MPFPQIKGSDGRAEELLGGHKQLNYGCLRPLSSQVMHLVAFVYREVVVGTLEVQEG